MNAIAHIGDELNAGHTRYDPFASSELGSHGELHFKVDAATGLRAIVAIHNTRLGPALGGSRCIEYPSTQAAIEDALRLARGMSYKAALSGLPYGGGKGVLIRPAQMNDRREYFKAYADFIESFQGRFITAEDSGTGVADMDVMAEVTHHVLGTSAGSGDPSPYTALGVRRSIEAAVKHRQNRSDLQGLRIAIQGLGHVGYALAQELADHGAELTVTDIDAETVQRCADEFGARPVSPQAIYSVDCDVFAPCALGAVLNDQTLRQLQARIIAGSANNQLLARSHGQELHCRRILYAPDYVANAGGLIYLALAKAGESEAVIKTRVEAIYATLLEIFRRAQHESLPPAEVADALAEARLGS